MDDDTRWHAVVSGPRLPGHRAGVHPARSARARPGSSGLVWWSGSSPVKTLGTRW